MTKHLALRLPCAALLGWGALSCTGSIDGGATGSSGGGDPSSLAPGDQPVVAPPGVTQFAKARARRLTGEEIQNSAKEVFSVVAPEVAFPTEGVAHEFSNRFDALSASLAVVEALQTTAEALASKAVDNLDSLVVCEPSAADAACAEAFIRDRGELAYRRALTAEEVSHLMEVFTEARALTDFKTSIATVIEAMLQSPHFLFRTELGSSADAGKSLIRLTPEEHASALAYYLWQGPPDRALLQAARAGELSTPVGLRQVAARLVADPRARRSLQAFFLDWFEVKDVASAGLSSERYPEFTPSLAASMLASTTALVNHVVWDTQSHLAGLFSGGQRFVDPALGQLLGLPLPAEAKLAPVAGGEQYAGLFTEPAFLATHSRPSSFSPVFLGHFVRSKLLCQTLPPPPNDVPALPEDSTSTNPRERFAQHENNPACSGCHELMDPIGFAFERYDALGRPVSTAPNGAPLTAAGRLNGTDVDTDFIGPVELGAKLGSSDKVSECFTAQLMEFALGREVSDEALRLEIDQSSLQAAAGAELSMLASFTRVAESDALFLRDASGVPAGGVQ